MQDAERPAAGSVERRGRGGGQQAEGREPAAAGGGVRPAAHLPSAAEPGGEGEI